MHNINDDFVVPATLLQKFEPIVSAIRSESARFMSIPDLVGVRPGFHESASDAVPALVLSMLPPLTGAAQQSATNLSRALNFHVEVEEASPQEQVEYFAKRGPSLQSDLRDLLEPAPLDFRPPVRGQYTPPDDLQLTEVDEPMRLTIATSPDAGWPVLRDFLADGVNNEVKVGIYQFTAPHIYKALRRAMLDVDGAVLNITLHPRPEKIPESGTKAEDIFGPTILERLENALGGRFQHAMTTLGEQGEFASAYHIKVAVIDKKRVWLSSGNWQSSNQPPFDPFSDDELPEGFHRIYNREHHVVIDNAALAKTFASYLDYDFSRASAAIDFAIRAPELFVDVDLEVPDFAPPVYFPPLHLEEKIRVQPLLTPDNYPQAVFDLIEGAKSRLWIQNQYINLNPQGDLPEFKRIINLILKKIETQPNLDVRIICRNLMDQAKLDLLLALGFPRKIFKFMSATHTKVIIVDDERVLIGSHNFSNEGVVSNRDASLIIHHRDAVKFCADVFDYDWKRRSNSKPARRKPRVARPGETSGTGSRRVAWSAVYDEPPRNLQQPVPLPRSAAIPSFDVGGGPARSAENLYVNGLNGMTGEPLVPAMTMADLAERLRGGLAPVAPEVRSSATAATFRSFGLPDAINSDDIRQAGWGVVVPRGREELFDRIRSLWNHRGRTVPADRLKRLTYNPGERCRDWLRRHGMAYGSQLPTAVPYHLVLLGTPAEISFEFQYLLDLEYSVGRLSFSHDADWGRYCDAVVRTEIEGSSRSRSIAWFAPRHDPATTISHDELVDPLTKEDPSGLTSLSGYESHKLLAADATRSRLLATLNERKPAFLFTASHGLGLPKEHADQAALQGALVTSDWTRGAIGIDQCLAGQHITSDVRGMIAFLFACYGAGTPREDDYPRDLSAPRPVLADAPFVAALPQALLANGALAVIGHVDRAWACSIRPAAVKLRIGPFRNLVDRILRGRCVGNATRDFSERSAILSQELLDLLQPGNAEIDDETLVWNWVERNDARAYILLGDPAVKLGR